jgi:hypothetical protein
LGLELLAIDEGRVHIKGILIGAAAIAFGTLLYVMVGMALAGAG